MLNIDSDPFYIRVLDIATGTGMRALDFAESHPGSRVIATNLSMIQPSNSWATNLHFIRENFEECWAFEQDLVVNYIHLRAVCTCSDDTRTVVGEAFGNRSEGARIELQDNVGHAQAVDDRLQVLPFNDGVIYPGRE
ncbi:hypothetical protein BJ170DRAFT_61647 [Xylariales sp. AK1849]|nr:hypothetical protein BJ170DRAFT_61647 [Xylariales sp. AK1849]